MATTKYTQEQINAALAEELRLNPSLSQAALTSAGKSLGLSDAQINAAFDTIAGFNAQGQYDAADYIANRVAGKPDYQMVVDAANAANPYSAQNMAKVDVTRQGQYVTDPVTGKPVALSAYSAGFDINNPTALTYLGELASRGGTDSTSQAFNAIATPAQKAEANRLWSIEKARLDEIDRVNALNASKGLLDAGVNNYAAGAVVNADGSVKIGDKLYSASDAALYNAYRGGNIAEVNRLLAANKLTGADVKSKFGLTDADIAWITNNAGGKFYSPTGTNTGITGIINTIAGNQNQVATQTAPVGQFRELFPSFAESKRLAGQMVAGRPTTESIISMINSNAARPVTVDGVNYSAPESAAYNAYRAGNMPEFNRLTQANQLTAPAMQSKFGLTDADMSWITNNAGGVFYNPTGTQQVAPPSLNNVLSMISK
jgi:hypothetical protein